MSVFFLGGSLLLASLSKSSVVSVCALVLFLAGWSANGLMWGWGARYLGVSLLPSWFGTSVFFVDVFQSSHLSSFPLLRRPGGEGNGGALFLLFWGIFSLFPVVGGFVSCFYEISRFYLIFFGCLLVCFPIVAGISFFIDGCTVCFLVCCNFLYLSVMVSEGGCLYSTPPSSFLPVVL